MTRALSISLVAILALGGTAEAHRFGRTARWFPPHRRHWSKPRTDQVLSYRSGLFSLVEAAAARHGVPARLARAIVGVESGGRCNAVSPTGARGPMQILPSTARAVGVAGNLTDCATGVEAGMRYLAWAVAVGGPGCIGASLYNAGIAAPHRCTHYGRMVVARLGGE